MDSWRRSHVDQRCEARDDGRTDSEIEVEGFLDIRELKDVTVSADARTLGFTLSLANGESINLSLPATALGPLIEGLTAGADGALAMAAADGVPISHPLVGVFPLIARDVYVGQAKEPGAGFLLVQLASSALSVRLPRAKMAETRNSINAYLNETRGKPTPKRH